MLDKYSMKHKHHIIPKHAGGTDEASNLIELTVEEHAEAHRILYEQYGRIQDKVAYMGLLKLAPTAELIHILQTEGMQGKNNPMYGKPAPNRGIKRPGVGGRKKVQVGLKKNVQSKLKQEVEMGTMIILKIRLELIKLAKQRKEVKEQQLVVSGTIMALSKC